jgi:hypothetical protein
MQERIFAGSMTSRLTIGSAAISTNETCANRLVFYSSKISWVLSKNVFTKTQQIIL